MPCQNTSGSGCDTKRQINKTVQMGGDASKSYNVKLHIRGIVEPMLYKDGMQSSIDSHFYVGGSPNNKDCNIYRLTIENPAKDYFLNSAPKAGDEVFVIDYTVDVVINGRSHVTLFADDQNQTSIRNKNSLTVPGIDTPTGGLSGQWVQMDVVSVTPAP